MAVNNICIFTILACFVICNGAFLGPHNGKRETGSWSFIQLRANNSKNCRYINNNFHDIAGSWIYVLRTVTSGTPPIHCGSLTVRETSENGFQSMLKYQTSEEKIDGFSMSGNFVDNTVVEIPELKKFVTGNPDWKYPSNVQMGLCDNDTILFIEPIHYYGGGMVFSRDIPKGVWALRMRFGTRDEERGKESTAPVGFKCSTKYPIY